MNANMDAKNQNKLINAKSACLYKMTGMAFHFFAMAGIALELYDVIRKDCIGQQYSTIKNWNFWLQKFLLSLTI